MSSDRMIPKMIAAVSILIFHAHVKCGHATMTEESALLSLKADWQWVSAKVRSWNESEDPCLPGWSGVVCARHEPSPTGSSGCEIADPHCVVVGLKLSEEGLTGTLPEYLSYLNNLERLDLHGNYLAGEISETLKETFSRILFLDLSSNYLNGSTPSQGARTARWEQNCFIAENGCQMVPDMRDISRCNQYTVVRLQACGAWGSQRRTLLLIVGISVTVSTVGIGFLLYCLVVRSKRKNLSNNDPLIGSCLSSTYHDCQHFSFHEMETATSKFAEKRLLGSGGFGYVYKGRLADGRRVAIKKLDKGSTQGEVEFWNEVLIIGTIQHPNVVSLLGYCKSALNSERILVYDYMANGSVLDALLDESEGAFPWELRFRVALGTATGLEFLHEKCSPKIIHRDIKPSNILLDEKYNARVGDFGLAKVARSDQSHITTVVVGTQGFLDPEYALTGKLTEKSDVFSFGMLLFVLISGRCTMETKASQRPSARQRVSEWMQILAKEGELSELVDARLNGVYDRNQMSRCAQVAMMCTRIRGDSRPTMGEVKRLLQGFSCQQPLSGVSSPAYSPGLISLRQAYGPQRFVPTPERDSFLFDSPVCTQPRPDGVCSPFTPYNQRTRSAIHSEHSSFKQTPFSPLFTPHHNGSPGYTRISPPSNIESQDLHQAERLGDSYSGLSDGDYRSTPSPNVVAR